MLALIAVADEHYWPTIVALASTIGGMALYIAKMWRDHSTEKEAIHARCSAEIDALNREYKTLLGKLLEDAGHDA